jgi:hypothetical protein
MPALANQLQLQQFPARPQESPSSPIGERPKSVGNNKKK